MDPSLRSTLSRSPRIPPPGDASLQEQALPPLEPTTREVEQMCIEKLKKLSAVPLHECDPLAALPVPLGAPFREHPRALRQLAENFADALRCYGIQAMNDGRTDTPAPVSLVERGTLCRIEPVPGIVGQVFERFFRAIISASDAILSVEPARYGLSRLRYARYRALLRDLQKDEKAWDDPAAFQAEVGAEIRELVDERERTEEEAAKNDALQTVQGALRSPMQPRAQEEFDALLALPELRERLSPSQRLDHAAADRAGALAQHIPVRKGTAMPLLIAELERLQRAFDAISTALSDVNSALRGLVGIDAEGAASVRQSKATRHGRPVSEAQLPPYALCGVIVPFLLELAATIAGLRQSLFPGARFPCQLDPTLQWRVWQKQLVQCARLSTTDSDAGFLIAQVMEPTPIDGDDTYAAALRAAQVSDAALEFSDCPKPPPLPEPSEAAGSTAMSITKVMRQKMASDMTSTASISSALSAAQIPGSQSPLAAPTGRQNPTALCTFISPTHNRLPAVTEARCLPGAAVPTDSADRSVLTIIRRALAALPSSATASQRRYAVEDAIREAARPPSALRKLEQNGPLATRSAQQRGMLARQLLTAGVVPLPPEKTNVVLSIWRQTADATCDTIDCLVRKCGLTALSTLLTLSGRAQLLQPINQFPDLRSVGTGDQHETQRGGAAGATACNFAHVTLEMLLPETADCVRDWCHDSNGYYAHIDLNLIAGGPEQAKSGRPLQPAVRQRKEMVARMLDPGMRARMETLS